MDPIRQLKQLIDDAGAWQHTRLLKRGELLKTEGSTDTRAFYITEGSVRIYLFDGVEEQTIRFAYTGSFVASLDSFISGKPSPLIIQAIKKTTVSIVEREPLMKIVHSHQHNLLLWMNIMEQLVCQQMEREVDLLTASPAERYHRVLQRSPQLFQQVPLKYIASYLRMTPETLSRIRKS